MKDRIPGIERQLKLGIGTNQLNRAFEHRVGRSKQIRRATGCAQTALAASKTSEHEELARRSLASYGLRVTDIIVQISKIFSTHNPCYTGDVQRNLTLTIDEDVLREARKVALDRNTSVNQLVRDYLVELSGIEERRRKARAELEEMFRQKPIRIGKRTWTRDELHER